MPRRVLTAVLLAFALATGARTSSGEETPDRPFQSFFRVGGAAFVQGGGSPSLWSSSTTGAEVTSFGDLHTFNVFFDNVEVGTSRGPSGVELMKQHVLFADDTNTWRSGWRADGAIEGVYVSGGEEVVGAWQVSPETRHAAVSDAFRHTLEDARFSGYTTVGVRYAKLEDDFSFLGLGSILGKTSVATEIDHNLVGPQFGLGAVAESGMWRFEGVLLALLGYQRVEYQQYGLFGEEAIPGALNRSAVARTTRSKQEYGEENFARNGEVRLTASCQVTSNVRVDAGWRGVTASELHNAASATAWTAPSFGINPQDGKSETFDYWTFGLTYVY
ncbi:hypothetical protein Pla108_33740 [Botrimarina colliarenosi]|uniref:DUF481 domain-containing protein n=1 Tax=Botrimarina colliarenosi TaxID=2528001 RepID=A0A5C6A879_9BACT|nr:hypothetical protein [Botrimarina colliarenosi]TWT95231.1 hypothetical protein Pla108_33740 [Botrimarina colliarenosi]